MVMWYQLYMGYNPYYTPSKWVSVVVTPTSGENQDFLLAMSYSHKAKPKVPLDFTSWGSFLSCISMACLIGNQLLKILETKLAKVLFRRKKWHRDIFQPSGQMSSVQNPYDIPLYWLVKIPRYLGSISSPISNNQPGWNEHCSDGIIFHQARFPLPFGVPFPYQKPSQKFGVTKQKLS